MNNGVENNQNIAMEQPVLTPVGDANTATTVPTQVVSDEPSIISTDAVLTTPSTPAIEIGPTIDPLTGTATTPVATETTPITPAAPVMVSPTDVVTTVSPTVETTPQPTEMELPSMKVDASIEEEKKKKKKKKEKEKKVKEKPEKEVKPRKSSFPTILFFIIVLMGVYIYYSYNNYQTSLSELKYKCSPVNETREEIPLDVNSTLVQDLYSKVATSIREDVAQPEWNDKMKIYLAFRQLKEKDMYDSNCNMFSAGRMEPYTCEESVNFKPKAFLTSKLLLEWKKLYGEETPMPLINIKLENACIGGYEYIKERDEYVQGYCKQNTATSYRVKKTLTEAISSRNTIVLVEEVQYAGNEKLDLPSYLKSGTYYYTFRLDMNYNYVLLAKTYNEKY